MQNETKGELSNYTVIPDRDLTIPTINFVWHVSISIADDVVCLEDMKMETDDDMFPGVEISESANHSDLLPKDGTMANTERSPIESEGISSSNMVVSNCHTGSSDSNSNGRRPGSYAPDGTSNETPDDTLLQEAVDSILL